MRVLQYERYSLAWLFLQQLGVDMEEDKAH